MIRRRTWGQHARDWIDRALAEGRRLGLEGPELAKFVRKQGWPPRWGERKHWPYRAWLRQVRLALSGRPWWVRRRRRSDLPGQLRLDPAWEAPP